MLKIILYHLVLVSIVGCTPIKDDYSHGNVQIEINKYHRLRNHRLHKKIDKERCNNQRCNMVCPINVIYGSPGTVTEGGHQSTSKPDTFTSNNEDTVTTKPEDQSTAAATETTTVNNVKTTTAKVINQITNLTRHVENAISRILKSNRDIIGLSTKNEPLKRIPYHRIENVRNIWIDKKTKKSMYMVRHLLPNGCYILCTGEQQYPQEEPNDQQGPPSEGEDSEGETPYHEGEDTPIEATISPGGQRRINVGNIRPFGDVDFIGLSDFGPNGWPAMDTEYYEDKLKKPKLKRKRYHSNEKS